MCQQRTTGELHTFVVSVKFSCFRFTDYFATVLQVINAQLHASQIENRHLRRCGVPLQLQELQDAYAVSTEALEVTMLLYYILALLMCCMFRFL